MLLERDAQLAAVQDYLAEASAGHGRLLFVAGEAGVGKSTFVGQVMADSRGKARVASGACDGATTPPPLGPLVEMLPDLPPDLWPPETSRQEVFSRLVSALREPPRAEPYLLVVEDAHWADEATLDLIRHLARRVHGCRALVLVTYRHEDVVPGHRLRVLLGDTATAQGVRRLDLAPLSFQGVRRLVQEYALAHPETTPADPDQLYEVTGGNGFFVTEALSAGTAEVPPTVRDAVLARTARLSVPARHAMDVIALAGARTEVPVLQRVLGQRLAPLDEPLRRGLLRQLGGDVVFRHELARFAVAGEVPAFRRIAIHRELLAALRAQVVAGGQVSDARLAHHAEAAGDDQGVVEYATRAAARAAALGAHREAVRQYRRVLAHADRLPPLERADLLWALGYECYLTDELEDSIEAVGAAQRIWSSMGDTIRVGDAYRCLSRLCWFAGRNEEAEQQAALALEALEGSESVELAMAYSNNAQLRMLGSDAAGTRSWGARTLDLLTRLPDGLERTEVEIHVLNNLGGAELTVGNVDLGVERLTESLTLARAGDFHEHAARAYSNLASTAVVQRRHADARRTIEEGLEYCTDRDLDSWTNYLFSWQARLRLDQGDLQGAQQAADDVLRRETVAIGMIEAMVVAALARLRAGREGWVDPLERASRLAHGTQETQRVAPVTSVQCEVAWLQDDPDAAIERADAAWQIVSASDCPWSRGMVATWLGPEVVAGGWSDLGPIAPPFRLETQGRWVEAAECWRQLNSPYEQALALARSGDRELLTESVGMFDAFGAHAAAARSRALLRANGWSVPRGARAATRRHPSGLTTREVEVLDLLTEGLTDAGIADRLVISRRTAEHHVAAILAKLGVDSRREAVLVGTADIEMGVRHP